MKSKTWLSSNYFIQFLVTGTFLPFWLSYLTMVKGLSILEASSVFSMVYLARVVSAIFVSPLLIRHFTASISLKIVTFSGLAFALLYGVTDEKVFLMLITFFFGLTFFTTSPLTEGLASIFLKLENIDYGRARLYGSLGYLLVGVILGGLVSYIGYTSLYYILVLLLAFYCIFFILPQPQLVRELKISNNDNDTSRKPYVWLMNNKNALLILAVIFMLQISHTAYNNYGILYLEKLNISEKWLMGIILNISVLAEILFFRFSDKLFIKFSATKLLTFACCMAVVRWLTLAIFQNVIIFTILQTFHALTFAMAQIAFILILNKNFNTIQILDMQNLSNAVCFQLSNFIGVYIIGYVWEIGMSYVFIISAVFAAVAVIISLFLKFQANHHH